MLALCAQCAQLRPFARCHGSHVSIQSLCIRENVLRRRRACALAQTRLEYLNPGATWKSLYMFPAFFRQCQTMEDLIFDQGRIGDSHHRCVVVVTEPHDWRAWRSQLSGHTRRARYPQLVGGSASWLPCLQIKGWGVGVWGGR